MTLDDFLSRLDAYPGRIPLRQLNDWMRDLEINWDQIRPYVHFGDETYRRNLMRAGEGYHALILCWRHGQRSPIHDHAGSSCGVRVLKGIATETVFDQTSEGHVYAVRTRNLEAGFTCATQDLDIHQISNIEPGCGDLITLHVYSPPLLVMGTYSLTSTQRGEFADRIYEFCEGAGI